MTYDDWTENDWMNAIKVQQDVLADHRRMQQKCTEMNMNLSAHPGCLSYSTQQYKRFAEIAERTLNNTLEQYALWRKRHETC